MSGEGASAAKTLAAVKAIGITHALMIPDTESRLLYEALRAEPEIEVISPCREGESVAIAAGLWAGGRKPLIAIQNTGLMEAGDALRGCGAGPRVPLLLLVGWRGYAGARAGKKPTDSAYTYTEPLLGAWGIPHRHLMGDGDLPAIEWMDRTAAETSRPAAVLSGHGYRP